MASNPALDIANAAEAQGTGNPALLLAGAAESRPATGPLTAAEILRRNGVDFIPLPRVQRTLAERDRVMRLRQEQLREAFTYNPVRPLPGVTVHIPSGQRDPRVAGPVGSALAGLGSMLSGYQQPAGDVPPTATERVTGFLGGAAGLAGLTVATGMTGGALRAGGAAAASRIPVLARVSALTPQLLKDTIEVSAAGGLVFGGGRSLVRGESLDQIADHTATDAAIFGLYTLGGAAAAGTLRAVVRPAAWMASRLGRAPRPAETPFATPEEFSEYTREGTRGVSAADRLAAGASAEALMDAPLTTLRGATVREALGDPATLTATALNPAAEQAIKPGVRAVLTRAKDSANDFIDTFLVDELTGLGRQHPVVADAVDQVLKARADAQAATVLYSAATERVLADVEPEIRRQIGNLLEGRLHPTTPAERVAHDAIRHQYDEVLAMARAAGFETPRRFNFFNHIFPREWWEQVTRESGPLFEQALKDLQRAGEASSRTEAVGALRTWRGKSTIRKAGSLWYEQSPALTGYFKGPEATTLYYDSVFRDIIGSWRFGRNLERLQPAADILEAAQPGAGARFKEVVVSYLSGAPIPGGSPMADSLTSAYRSAIAVTALSPGTALLQGTQTMTAMAGLSRLYGGLDSFLRVAQGTARYIAEAESREQALGAGYYNLLQQTRRALHQRPSIGTLGEPLSEVSGKFMERQGINWADEVTRGGIELATDTFLTDATRMLRNGEFYRMPAKQRQVWHDLFRMVGVTEEQVARGLTNPMLRERAKILAQKALAQDPERGVPAFFNNTAGRILWLFRRYPTMYAENVTRYILGPLARGDAAPLLFWTTGNVAFGEVNADIRAWLAGRQRPDSIPARLLDDIMWAGALGMYGDLARSATLGRSASSLAGAPISITADFADAFGALMSRGDPNPLKRFAARRIPMIGPLVGGRIAEEIAPTQQQLREQNP